jgi:hypothetical protein
LNSTANASKYLISCHDCGKPVSLSARQCPQCGSRDPAGPVRVSRRASRSIGAEARNDRTLIWMMVVLGAVGAFYGVEISTALFGEIIFGALYSFVGVCIAVPLAFAINVTRHWI